MHSSWSLDTFMNLNLRHFSLALGRIPHYFRQRKILHIESRKSLSPLSCISLMWFHPHDLCTSAMSFGSDQMDTLLFALSIRLSSIMWFRFNPKFEITLPTYPKWGFPGIIATTADIIFVFYKPFVYGLSWISMRNKQLCTNNWILYDYDGIIQPFCGFHVAQLLQKKTCLISSSNSNLAQLLDAHFMLGDRFRCGFSQILN